MVSSFRNPALVIIMILNSLIFSGCSQEEDAGTRFLITNAQVVDGTGSPSRLTSVRIEGERIIAVGDLTATPDETVIDATGLILAPGFIDSHSHHGSKLFELPDALGAVSQGITTVVVGKDGDSQFPLEAFFDSLNVRSVAINVASYVGHNTLRRRVMQEDYQRPATDNEIDTMKQLLRQEMAAGALGLSSGLEYDPGIYSDTSEVLALAQEAANLGGRYCSHIRSEDRHFWEAIEEIIQIGKATGMPVQISHLKLAMKSFLGQTSRLLDRLNQARDSGIQITADVYPYVYWQSTMTVLFPERDFTNRATATFALDEIAPPDGIILSRYEPNPDYVGKTITEIAALRDMDPVTTYMDLIAEVQKIERETGASVDESIIARSMDPEDVANLIAWSHTNICSDGGLAGGHPRGFGTFTRILGRYVREEQRFSMEDAVHKMSGLAAEHMGISDRGVIRVGAYADLVLFDPERVSDRATFEEPHLTSTGIEKVWVNGALVYTDGKPTGNHPGQVMRKQTL